MANMAFYIPAFLTWKYVLRKRGVEWVELLLSILEVSVSNLGPDTGYSGWYVCGF
jgi:hypothetical protein